MACRRISVGKLRPERPPRDHHCRSPAPAPESPLGGAVGEAGSPSPRGLTRTGLAHGKAGAAQNEKRFIQS